MSNPKMPVLALAASGLRAVLAACLLSLGIAGQVTAAEATVERRFNELADTIALLRQIEGQGKKIQAARDSNRRDIARVESAGAVLTQENAELERRRADYTAALGDFNNQCRGKRLPPETLQNCRDREQQLQTTAAALDNRADSLRPRIQAYNREIDAFNKRDSELARQEEALYAYTQEHVQVINDLKAELSRLAAASKRDRLVENVRTCNELTGFEDTLTCVRVVWDMDRR